MENTPRLKLPYIMPSQAQKHVTHNEAIRKIDTLLHLTITSFSLTEPPENANDGSVFSIANNAKEEWSGRDGQIAIREDGAWQYESPIAGLIAYDLTADAIAVFDELGWKPAFTRLERFGVNADASAEQKFIVSSQEVSFTHNGFDQRVSISKASSDASGSIVFKNNWTALAELGLCGNDNFFIKTNAGNASSISALEVDTQTGKIGLGKSPEAEYTMAVDGDVDISSSSWSTLSVRSINGQTSGAGIALHNAQNHWAISHRGETQNNEMWFMFNNGSRTHLTQNGGWKFKSIGTTAAAPNAVLDASDNNSLLRSTSSAQFKRDLEPIEIRTALALLKAKPIWYRSRCDADREDWSWYGFLAEDVVKIDPRMVHWGKMNDDSELDDSKNEMPPREAVGVYYDRFVVMHNLLINDIMLRLARLEGDC